MPLHFESHFDAPGSSYKYDCTADSGVAFAPAVAYAFVWTRTRAIARAYGHGLVQAQIIGFQIRAI